MKTRDLLAAVHPSEIVDAILLAYREIESGYAMQKWKVSELDAGHFVESVRRLLEHTLFGSYTPIGTDLPKFNEAALGKYASTNPTADESYRLLIPRALWSIYGIRSKRGVGHVGKISPNEMDATLMLYSAKWILAELVRLSASVSTTQAQVLISEIVERQLEILWKHDGGALVLDPRMDTRGQVLVHLYSQDGQTMTALLGATRYRNATNFRKIIARLEKKRLIVAQSDGKCLISPTGSLEAERIILAHGMVT